MEEYEEDIESRDEYIANNSRNSVQKFISLPSANRNSGTNMYQSSVLSNTPDSFSEASAEDVFENISKLKHLSKPDQQCSQLKSLIQELRETYDFHFKLRKHISQLKASGLCSSANINFFIDLKQKNKDLGKSQVFKCFEIAKELNNLSQEKRKLIQIVKSSKLMDAKILQDWEETFKSSDVEIAKLIEDLNLWEQIFVSKTHYKPPALKTSSNSQGKRH
jgi:hypothetical protein